MHFRLLFEDATDDESDDGTPVLELDEEGIEWLEQGLAELREAEAGDTISSPTLVSNDGEPLGIGSFELRKA